MEVEKRLMVFTMLTFKIFASFDINFVYSFSMYRSEDVVTIDVRDARDMLQKGYLYLDVRLKLLFVSDCVCQNEKNKIMKLPTI